MSENIVITGIGMVTPLGDNPATVLQKISEGVSAAAPPTNFDSAVFGCPVCAEVRDFKPERYISETKLIRLMNRDAQLAVAAARLALADSELVIGRDCAPENMALFGATGVVGLPLGEVVPLMKASAAADGRFDPGCFGREGLRAVSPILSFKILSNMPLCFVSICENIQGANGIYTPWEGQGAQAVEAGIRALQCGDARCALVGGCDVKTHEWALLNLSQQGLFESWQKTGAGMVPGEGAAFLMLERETDAAARGARTYARISGFSLRTQRKGSQRSDACIEVLKQLNRSRHEIRTVVGSGNNDEETESEQESVMRFVLSRNGSIEDVARPSLESCSSRREEAHSGFRAEKQSLLTSAATVQPSLWNEGDRRFPPAIVINPKRHLGDLFAAAGLVQIGLAALLANQRGGSALANCFGYGSEQAAFLLEKT